MNKKDKYDMQFIHHIFNKHKIPAAMIVTSVVMLVVYFVSNTIAAGPFDPGTELDPDCQPGDLGCIVEAAAPDLESVLTTGNTTGTNDILIDTTSNRTLKQDDGDGFSGNFWNGLNFNQTSGMTLFSSNYSGLVNNGVTQVIITPTAMTIDGDSSFGGVKYQENYSANFTARSLVDKDYVDSVAGGSPTLYDVLSQGNIMDDGAGSVIAIEADDGTSHFDIYNVSPPVIRAWETSDSSNVASLKFNTLGGCTSPELRSDFNSFDFNSYVRLIVGHPSCITPSQITVGAANVGAFPGIVYEADYSANFVGQSL